MIRKSAIFFLILTFVLALYYPAIFTYFSQDDFFHFKVSQTNGTLGEYLNLFAFHPFDERGIAFYRPISRELPFNLFYNLFGLNPVPFRVFTFLIHFINIYLVFHLVTKLFGNKYLSFFVSFFFGITAANVATLYYLAGGIQTLLATTFTLSTLIFFHLYLKTVNLKFKLLSFLTFLLGISSHEQAFVIPFLLIGLTFISKSNSIKKYLFDLLIFFLISCLFLYLELFKIGFSSNELQYRVVFSLKTAINSLFWYSSWALGIPETLIDFVFPGFKLNPTLLRYWSKYYMIIFPSFFLCIFLFLFALFYLFLKRSKVFTDRRFLFHLIWFPLGLIPVLLLPLHKSTHYLTISLPAFWTIMFFLIFNFYQEFKNKHKHLSKIIVSLFIVSLFTLSATSAILGSTNYWAATRGKLAEKLIKEVTSNYPNLPKGAVVYFKNDPKYPVLTEEWGKSSKQASTILNGSDALQLLYKDPSLKVYYEDIKMPPKLENNIYTLVAKIY